MSLGVQINPADGVPWHFDTGAASLDFAYTGAIPHDDEPAEHLPDEASLGAWLAARWDIAAELATERDLADAHTLRASIARLYTARADDLPFPADDVDTLNLFAATPDVPPALAGGRRQAGATRLRAAQTLSTLARDAVAVLAAGEQRVRRCAADDCRLVFHDESRTNTRRWCAMERCGNRAKVRAHRERAASRRVAQRAEAVAG